MKKLIILLLIGTYQFIVSEEVSEEAIDLEGSWFAAYLPNLYESAIEIRKTESGYIGINTIANDYIPFGKEVVKFNLDFKDCKGKAADKGYRNPRFLDCTISVVKKNLISAKANSSGWPVIFYRDDPISNKPLCMIDSREKLASNSLDQILKMRPKAFKHCLNCNGDQCNLKVWSPGKEKESLICKKLFCKPADSVKKEIVSMSNSTIGSGETEVEFSYRISSEGKITSIKIDSAKGAMNKKQAGEFTKDMLRGLSYLPIKNEGQVYEINNLRGWLKLKINDNP